MTEEELKSGVITIFTFFAFRVLQTIFYNNLSYHSDMMGQRSHSALKALVYKKHYKISSATNRDFTTGEIYSVVNSDVGRLMGFAWSSAQSITIPIRFLYASFMLYYYLGWSILSGIAIFVVTYFADICLRNLNFTKYVRGRRIADKRSQMTLEAVSNAKLLKLYGWTDLFLSSICDKRDEEDEVFQSNKLARTVINTFMQILKTFLPISIYFTYIYAGNQLDMATRVTTGILISQVHLPFYQFKSKMGEYKTTMSAVKRIYKFVCCDEVQTNTIQQLDFAAESENAVEIKGDFSWGIGEQIKNSMLEEWNKAQEEEKEQSKKPKARWCSFTLPRSLRKRLPCLKVDKAEKRR